MYKVQIFYDDDCREAAIRAAAFRLETSAAKIEECWEDRGFFCKSKDGKPSLLLQPIRLVNLDDLEVSQEEMEDIVSYEDYYDGDELWIPLGWDILDVVSIKISSVFELGGCPDYEEIYYYC